MTEELRGSKPRFKNTVIYSLMNKLLMFRGLFHGVNFESLSFLDIGCGKANDISFIIKKSRQMMAVGLDIRTYQEWKHITHVMNVNFVMADAHYLPFRSETFDFVMIKDVLHHITTNRIGIIEEAFRVVKDQGILRVVEANRYHVNPILVFKQDNSHDHFTFEQLHELKKNLSFDELYGYELLPSFSVFKKDFAWNIFVSLLWFLAKWSIGRRFLILYTMIKEKLLKSNLTYYVLSKKKSEDQADVSK